MKRARLTAEHFAETTVVVGPGHSIVATERRRPDYARLRELMDQKRALDNAIHAERLRLRH